jgi:hypothetical protein
LGKRGKVPALMALMPVSPAPFDKFLINTYSTPFPACAFFSIFPCLWFLFFPLQGMRK